MSLHNVRRRCSSHGRSLWLHGYGWRGVLRFLVFLRRNMTKSPIAYAAVAMDASESTYVTTSREQAEAACREYGWQLVPLYAGPTFTAAEREAVLTAAWEADAHQHAQRAATLRGLLERMK